MIDAVGGVATAVENVIAEVPSVVRQVVEVGHEIARRAAPGSTAAGADHVLPLKVTAWPLSSVAAQLVDVGHATATNPPAAGSTLAASVQLVPEPVKASPITFTVVQAVGVAHEIASRAAAEGRAKADDQAVPLQV